MAVVAVAAAVPAVVIQLTKIIIDLHRHFGSATSPCATPPSLDPLSLSPLSPFRLLCFVQIDRCENLCAKLDFAYRKVRWHFSVYFFFSSPDCRTNCRFSFFVYVSLCLPLSSCLCAFLHLVLASLLKLKTKVALPCCDLARPSPTLPSAAKRKFMHSCNYFFGFWYF